MVKGSGIHEEVAKLLCDQHVTMSVAESCTGGLISYLLTSVPGSSAWFRGGVVAYSDDVKMRELGVSGETLSAEGAVSEEVAAQMASGVRQRLRTDIGVSVTGIAGPGGATAAKPVGLVYVGVDTGEGPKVRRFNFNGDRCAVREQSAGAALKELRDILRKGGN